MTIKRTEPWLKELLHNINRTIEANCPGEGKTFVFLLVTPETDGTDVRITGNTPQENISEVCIAVAEATRDVYGTDRPQ